MRRRRAGLPRTAMPVVIVLLLAGVFAAAIGLGQLLGLPGLWRAGPTSPSLSRSLPTRLEIPDVGVRAKLVEVGRAPDGSIATPTADPVHAAGWYRLGPTPGEAGTAVIVGHVDTANQPAVFAKLADLRGGRTVTVSRADRRTASFTVDSVERFPKTAFPAQRVFAAADRPRLVLITCGGSWVGGDVGYADNVIVFATMR